MALSFGECLPLPFSFPRPFRLSTGQTLLFCPLLGVQKLASALVLGFSVYSVIVTFMYMHRAYFCGNCFSLVKVLCCGFYFKVRCSPFIHLSFTLSSVCLAGISMDCVLFLLSTLPVFNDCPCIYSWFKFQMIFGDNTNYID